MRIHSFLWTSLLSITISVLVLPGTILSTETKIFERWAPVIHQAAVTDADFITAADFDGDWTGNNNWETFPDHPKPAYVYYDYKETGTHWFLFYALFHPRDYTTDPACPSGCHENDLEAVQLTVRKDGSKYGELEVLQTLHHGEITLYTNLEHVRGGFMEVAGPITMVKGRPAVYVEEYGHGIYGVPGESMLANPLLTDTVRYIYGRRAEVPGKIPDKQVSYALLPVYETFWPHRDCTGDGKCFDAIFSFRGARLPACIDGDTFGRDSANLPWGYGQARGDTLDVGDWFFDPAKAVSFHAGDMGDFSTEYIFNPYIADLREMGADIE